MRESAQDKSELPDNTQKTNGDKEKRRTKPNPQNGKELGELTQQDLTRTHKAFGLFPNALLLFGYGENRHENERIITTEKKILKPAS